MCMLELRNLLLTENAAVLFFRSLNKCKMTYTTYCSAV